MIILEIVIASFVRLHHQVLMTPMCMRPAGLQDFGS